MGRGDRFTGGDRTLGCFLVSSPQGHSGKTVVTVGLCKLLTNRGLSIQPFKKGPDYIDPSWLTIAAGRGCRNLDLFLIPKEKLIQTFARACEEADLAIVEGAMGLYDGLDSQQTTAEISRLLNIPILLVVNTSRMTGSIAAMVKGYQLFETGIKIVGVILNYVSGSRHEKKLREAVEEHCAIPVLGGIPRDPDLQIAERHLGLIPSKESSEAESLVERIGNKLKPYLDLDQILKIAQGFSPPRPSPRALEESRERAPEVRLGVMHDQVFNFYYPENLEALRQENAELIFINSLQDRLPPVDGLYIGGGFPEFFVKQLEENRLLRKDIAESIEAGLPVYAECAGLMYLCRKIHWQGRSHEMVGVIPAEVEISQRPEGHGYVLAEVTDENPLLPIGLTIRGHEFHHSRLSVKNGIRFAYEIKRGHGIDGKRDGIFYKNLFASYMHLHASGTPCWAEAFVSLARRQGKTPLKEAKYG
ncbi:MAG: hydrogenobyrinic acid a,c-diamide synthase (glutamine-hydrolyzing) [Syntrophaceae bacterium]|nr:hydrogenobyrinic acid a,c-diamide synthase (glutamine-hydrolyzing) [Syntrophaceae bacterium]